MDSLAAWRYHKAAGVLLFFCIRVILPEESDEMRTFDDVLCCFIQNCSKVFTGVSRVFLKVWPV